MIDRYKYRYIDKEGGEGGKKKEDCKRRKIGKRRERQRRQTSNTFLH